MLGQNCTNFLVSSRQAELAFSREIFSFSYSFLIFQLTIFVFD